MDPSAGQEQSREGGAESMAGAAGDTLQGAAEEEEEEEDGRRRRRAERFGTEHRPPALAGLPEGMFRALGTSQDPVTARHSKRDAQVKAELEARLKAKKAVFDTTVDVFSQDEQEKARKRAERFGIEEPKLITYEPVVIPHEEEELRKKRAERFGVEYKAVDVTGLRDADILEKRQDFDKDVARRPEAVHVYGVDIMSTKEIRQYFGEFDPVFVEWINDSCCNVLFEEPRVAKRAVVAMGKPLPPEEAPDGFGIDLTQLPYLWHRGSEPFVKEDGREAPLLFRIATVKDVKVMKTDHVTRNLWKDGSSGKRRAGDDAMEIEVEGDGQTTTRRRGGRKKRKDGRGEAMDIDDDLEGVSDLRQLLNRKKGTGLTAQDHRPGHMVSDLVTYDDL